MTTNQEIRDQYIIENTHKNYIGMGAFGLVYDCYRKDAKQQSTPLCVKIIKKNRIRLEQQIQEIEILKKIMKIQSEYLVRIDNIINSPHQFEIIMEKCDMDLDQEFMLLSKSNQWYSYSDCINILMQIKEGCRVLYENNIVHRDIKPSNILIKIINKGELNERRLYKISDFGFSQIVNSFCESDELSRSGTPYYTAPQVINNKPFSKKCDIYSYGIVFYQIFYFGQMPLNQNQNMDLKSFYNLLEKKQFKCNQLKYPSFDLISDLLEKMIVYNEGERISFDQLFQHPLLNQQEQGQSLDDSLFYTFINANQQQIKELSKEKDEKYIYNRLNRVYQIQVQLFRKYLFFKQKSSLLFQKTEIYQVLASFCLIQLAIQNLLYCMGFMHVIISDIHPYFKVNKDLDHLKYILSECFNNINKHPEYEELCKQIKLEYFKCKKDLLQYNIILMKFNSQIGPKNQIVDSFFKLSNDSEFRRINPNEFINFLKSIQELKLLEGFKLDILNAINLEEKFPIKDYKDIDPNMIFIQ